MSLRFFAMGCRAGQEALGETARVRPGKRFLPPENSVAPSFYCPPCRLSIGAGGNETGPGRPSSVPAKMAGGFRLARERNKSNVRQILATCFSANQLRRFRESP